VKATLVRARSPRHGLFKLTMAAVVLALVSMLSYSTPRSSAATAPLAVTGHSSGGTATFAELTGLPPNYIFPMDSLPYFSFNNILFLQFLLYRPLYFFGVGTDPVLNNTVSIANAPVYSDGDTTVTVTLKHYVWSDGTPVTAADIQFWQNLVTANKANWAAYAPGYYPDNVKSTVVVSPTTVVFHLTHAVDPTWFTYNELSQITPLPIQSMDKISATSPVKRYDETSATAVKVYNFLNSQSKILSTYATNPVWTTVDGPWKLASFNINGRAVFVPNSRYSGPIKASLSQFIEVPFTSDAAELDELRTGALTVGYLPYEDVTQQGAIAAHGYSLQPWQDYAFNYFAANEHNPTVGTILSQSYVREALEELVDQQGVIKAFYHGYAVQTCGPIPLTPGDPYVSSYEKSCPYSFNVNKAKQLLASHGWKVVVGGVTTCARPGAGKSECGAGIAAGAKLEFSFVFATGNVPLDESVQVYKADASQAGVVYNLSGQSFASVSGLALPCTAKQSTCGWQIADWGAGWLYSPDFYPTGEEIFATGAGGDTSNYTNKTDDTNIAASVAPGAGQATLDRYQNYLTSQVPFIWQPNAPYQLTEVSTKLKGVVPQNIYFNLLPEQWSFSK